MGFYGHRWCTATHGVGGVAVLLIAASALARSGEPPGGHWGAIRALTPCTGSDRGSIRVSGWASKCRGLRLILVSGLDFLLLIGLPHVPVTDGHLAAAAGAQFPPRSSGEWTPQGPRPYERTISAWDFTRSLSGAIFGIQLSPVPREPAAISLRCPLWAATTETT